jgi:predicted TIM-barrel fold metal-dependent hydrolase
LDRLLEQYDNLWLDLSARSGYNALTRDPEFTAGFVGRHWRKMLLGTDIVHANDRLPILEWLATLDVTDEVRQAIGEGNARRLLGLVDL